MGSWEGKGEGFISSEVDPQIVGDFHKKMIPRFGAISPLVWGVGDILRRWAGSLDRKVRQVDGW